VEGHGMATEETNGSPLANVHAGTASDFIMRTLIMDFREHTKKKLDDILKFSVVRDSVFDPFQLSIDCF
jgi:hypothetical protein